MGHSFGAFYGCICGIHFQRFGNARFSVEQALAIACCFGLFQGIMPAIGYVVGLQFSQMIQNWDHWIAFALLVLIGVNMIREGVSSDDEPALSH